MYSGWVEGVFEPKYCGVFLRRVEGAIVCFVFAPKERRYVAQKEKMNSTIFCYELLMCGMLLCCYSVTGYKIGVATLISVIN